MSSFFSNRLLARSRCLSPIHISCRLLSSPPTQAEAEEKARLALDKIYHEMVAQRFRDIVVLETKFNADPRYMILATAFNSRHMLNGTESMNKFYKSDIRQDSDPYANLSIAQEWNVLDMKSIVIHLFLKDCRDHFDVEQLWAVGEKYDSLSNPIKIKDDGNNMAG